MASQGVFKPEVLFHSTFDVAAEHAYAAPAFPTLDQDSSQAKSERCFLRLSLVLAPGASEAWRQIVVRLGDYLLFEGPVHGGVTLAFRLPCAAVERLPDSKLEIQQSVDEQPPALRLASVELIRAPAVRHRLPSTSLTDLEAKELVTKFESLGDNCEFGIFQRGCGAEPLGLLRFSSARIDRLLAGIETGFQGLQTRAQFEVFLAGPPGLRREYLVHQKTYTMIYHTGVFEGELTANQITARELTRLQYLRRKLMEDLEDAEKIFVCRRMPPLTEQEVLPIWLAMRMYGPNTLLWAVPAAEGHPAGSVERIMDGLLRGYVDRLAPYENATDVSFGSWLEMCRNAMMLAAQ